MEKPKTTPKDFFLWAGAMISLYAGVVAFIALLFDYINYTFPNALQYYVDPYQSGIAYSMAMLIVLAPVFLILMRVIRRNIAADPSRGEIWVRRWALYLTVFAAGVTIVVDLIVLLYTFLNGEELTTAFLLKVLVVLLVTSAGFMHFLADLWGHWIKYPSRARLVNYGVGVVVAAAIIAGFLIVGTPQQARLYRLDDQKISDLQSLQSQITNFYQLKRELPSSLGQLNDPLLYFSVPVDPQTGESYEYKKTADLGFELCASFNLPSRANVNYRTMPVMVGGKGVADNWQHETGQKCFVRSIDPDLFPPYTKSAL